MYWYSVAGLADNRVGSFRNYFRMTRNQLNYILESIQNDVSKAATNPVPISAEERLMVRLTWHVTNSFRITSNLTLHY